MKPVRWNKSCQNFPSIRVTNSFQCAWKCPGFSTEGPTSQKPHSPGQSRTVCHSTSNKREMVMWASTTGQETAAKTQNVYSKKNLRNQVGPRDESKMRLAGWRSKVTFQVDSHWEPLASTDCSSLSLCSALTIQGSAPGPLFLATLTSQVVPHSPGFNTNTRLITPNLSAAFMPLQVHTTKWWLNIPSRVYTYEFA